MTQTATAAPAGGTEAEEATMNSTVTCTAAYASPSSTGAAQTVKVYSFGSLVSCARCGGCFDLATGNAKHAV